MENFGNKARNKVWVNALVMIRDRVSAKAQKSVSDNVWDNVRDKIWDRVDFKTDVKFMVKIRSKIRTKLFLLDRVSHLLYYNKGKNMGKLRILKETKNE